MKNSNNQAYEFIEQDKQCFSFESLESLKEKAFSHSQGVYRYNLHINHHSTLQQMLICLTQKAVCNIHQHTDKDETLQIIEGKIEVTFYDEELKVSKNITMEANDKKSPFIITIKRGSIHSVKTCSISAIIYEVTSGPFIKENTKILGEC